jgi:hypothetical protein
MQKNHLENTLSIADSISLLSSNFEYLLTKNFFENWDNSLENLINNNFQTINSTLFTYFKDAEQIHTSFAENILVLLNNIPSFNVIKPLLDFVENLSISLPHINNSLSTKQFVDWYESISFLTTDQFNSYNINFKSFLIDQYNTTTFSLSNILTKLIDLENFESLWSFWSINLESKIDLFLSEQP